MNNVKKYSKVLFLTLIGLFILSIIGNRTRMYFLNSIMEQAEIAYKQGNYDLAIKNYTIANKLIFNKEEKASNIFWCGRAYYYGEQNYDKAIDCFSRAIKLHPDFYVYYLWRGRAYVKKREWDLAIEEYNKSIELKPDAHEIIKELADIYYYKGDYTPVVFYYNRAIKTVEDNITNRMKLHEEYPDAGFNYNDDLYQWRNEVIIQRNFVEKKQNNPEEVDVFKRMIIDLFTNDD